MYSPRESTQSKGSSSLKDGRKTSGGDRKNHGMLLLTNRIARLLDCYTEIEAAVSNAENLNESEIRQKLKEWKRSVLPFMKTALETEIPQALKDLHSFPSMAYVHQMNESQETSNARESNSNKRLKKSLPLRRIENTVHNQNRPDQPRNVLPLKRPLPLNGQSFSPSNRLSTPRQIKSPKP
jgi:hypothetical protein